MKATYKREYRKDARGYICLHKRGAKTISLIGAMAMSQKELDFYGEIMADALANMSDEQKQQFHGVG